MFILNIFRFANLLVLFSIRSHFIQRGHPLAFHGQSRYVGSNMDQITLPKTAAVSQHREEIIFSLLHFPVLRKSIPSNKAPPLPPLSLPSFESSPAQSVHDLEIVIVEKEMKSPLRKFRGLALPHNHKERKDQRPPPAKLDDLVDAAQVSPTPFSDYGKKNSSSEIMARRWMWVPA